MRFHPLHTDQVDCNKLPTWVVKQTALEEFHVLEQLLHVQGNPPPFFSACFSCRVCACPSQHPSRASWSATSRLCQWCCNSVSLRELLGPPGSSCSLYEIFLSLHPAHVLTGCDFHVPLSCKLLSSLAITCLRPFQTNSGEMKVTSKGSHILLHSQAIFCSW